MSPSRLTDTVSYIAGAVAGAVVYLLGYLVTYLTMSGSVEERLQGFNFVANVFGGDPIKVWQGVGWLFYNAHFVRTRISSGLGPDSENFIAASDGGAIVLLYLVPVVFLFAAGFLLARSADVDASADGAAAGASVVVGYFPLALLGGLLFSYGDSIAPDLVTAILLAGLVYPLVFGAIGGAGHTMLGQD